MQKKRLEELYNLNNKDKSTAVRELLIKNKFNITTSLMLLS